MAERVAIYPGSFDPPTLGHLDLIERAAKIFDKVIVAVALNDAKTELFSVGERIEMLEGLAAHLPNIALLCPSPPHILPATGGRGNSPLGQTDRGDG